MYKLFVGGISQDTTEQDLQHYFQDFGIISSCVIVMDKLTKASKGYAFINCEDKKTYLRILEFDSHSIKGRTIDVNKALTKDSKIPEEVISKGYRKLFIGGLPLEATNQDLEEYFSTYGEISNAYVILDPNSKISKRFGYVEFVDKSSADSVLMESEHFILERKITVENQRKGLKTSIEFEKKELVKTRKEHFMQQPCTAFLKPEVNDFNNNPILSPIQTSQCLHSTKRKQSTLDYNNATKRYKVHLQDQRKQQDADQTTSKATRPSLKKRMMEFKSVFHNIAVCQSYGGDNSSQLRSDNYRFNLNSKLMRGPFHSLQPIQFPTCEAKTDCNMTRGTLIFPEYADEFDVAYQAPSLLTMQESPYNPHKLSSSQDE